MAWTLLIVAGLFEIAWAAGMKHTHGWTRLWPSAFTLVTMAVSFYLLSRAMRTLPAGTAYAVWTGIGAVGVAVYGVVRLNEPATPARLACFALIVLGIVGLKVLTPAPPMATNPAPTTQP